MNEVFKYKANNPTNWFHSRLEKSNRYCLYCGVDLNNEKVPSNKEHLIAREFVPTGSFSGSCFNFIFRACQACNEKKSDLERHVSSVTLLTSPSCGNDIAIRDLARRKGEKDFHPDKKGVSVGESGEDFSFTVNPLPGMQATFGLIAPPQVKGEYASELAYRHIQGLFSLVTSSNPQEASGTMLLSPNHFQIFGIFKHGNWGDPQLVELIRRTSDWVSIACIITANGFFKARLRRSENDAEGWFWALEWNKSYRVVGTISSSNPDIFQNLPPRKWIYLGNDRISQAIPLPPEEDELFS